MKKKIISLSIIALLSICVFNSVAAAPVSKQTTDVHYAHTTYVKSDRSIQITITSYPQQVDVGKNFDVRGVLSENGKGIGNAQVDHLEYVYGSLRLLWTVTTNQDGSFVDTFHFSEQGQHKLVYGYTWGSNDVCTADITINAIPK